MGCGRISVPRPRHRIVCFRLGFSLDVQTVSQPETCTQNMSEEGQLELLVLLLLFMLQEDGRCAEKGMWGPVLTASGEEGAAAWMGGHTASTPALFGAGSRP